MERGNLAGTGTSSTFREQVSMIPGPGTFSVLRDRIAVNGKRSKFPVIGSYRDLENIPTDVGTR